MPPRGKGKGKGKVKGDIIGETDGTGYVETTEDPTYGVYPEPETDDSDRPEREVEEPDPYTIESGVTTYGGFDVMKNVIVWSTFWSDASIPVVGYDAVDDKLVILKGADHSVDSSKDIVVYDFVTGSWTRGDTKFSGSLDISNMITAPDTGELVALKMDTSAGNNLKRFQAHQPVSGSSIAAASQTVNIVTPFYDFGSSGQKKRLYKVTVLGQGANMEDLVITASYDGNTGTYENIFSSNTFVNTTADDWDAKIFTVSSPKDFDNISVKIYSTGAMTTANWGISEISFIYREKGIR